MKLFVANTLNIAFVDPPDEFVTFLCNHIPDLLSENDLSADVLIRFVDHLNGDDELLIEPFARQGGGRFFYVDKYGNKAIVPLENMATSKPLEILVEKTVLPSLFYEVIIRMTIRHLLLQKGITFVHASGISIEGQGIIFPAWGGTGKTNIVIQFLQDGADYLGDDLVLVSSDDKIYAFPESITMFDYNFKMFPEYKAQLGIKKKGLFFLKIFMETLDDITCRLLGQGSLLRATISRMAMLSKSFTTVSMGYAKLASQSRVLSPVSLKKVVFLTRANIESPELVKESPSTLATRMAACLDFEHIFQARYIDAFSFGLPEKPVTVLRDAYKKEREILEIVFSRASICHLRIPREMDNKALYVFIRRALDL